MRWLQIGLHGVLGLSALVVGFLFVSDPSGGALGMQVGWLEGSPFADYLVPGLFLGLVISSTNLGSALLLWRRHPLGEWLSVGTGLLLVVWLAIQTAILGVRDVSQVIWWVLFPGLTLIALLRLRRPR